MHVLWVRGRGEPLLLIMGLGGHILDWGWALPQELAKRYKVIVFDNRGSGRTDLTLQGALWWSAPAGYHPFIYDHPEIVERKIPQKTAAY